MHLALEFQFLLLLAAPELLIQNIQAMQQHPAINNIQHFYMSTLERASPIDRLGENILEFNLLCIAKLSSLTNFNRDTKIGCVAKFYFFNEFQ